MISIYKNKSLILYAKLIERKIYKSVICICFKVENQKNKFFFQKYFQLCTKYKKRKV